eukprot:scaffold140497_cov29-Tisochrysis_lutea.AAC.5
MTRQSEWPGSAAAARADLVRWRLDGPADPEMVNTGMTSRTVDSALSDKKVTEARWESSRMRPNLHLGGGSPPSGKGSPCRTWAPNNGKIANSTIVDDGVISTSARSVARISPSPGKKANTSPEFSDKAVTSTDATERPMSSARALAAIARGTEPRTCLT